MKLTIKTYADLDHAAREILKLSVYKVFTLTGNLGSGKTTLVKSIVKELKSSDEVSSPSFSIVNEYLFSNGGKIYHFDLYRIQEKEELTNIGFNEYIDSGNYCFIEWPEISKSELPEHHEISLHLENNIRTLTFI